MESSPEKRALRSRMHTSHCEERAKIDHGLGCVSGHGLNYLVFCSSHMNGQEYGDLVLDIVYPMVATSERLFSRGQCTDPQMQGRLTTQTRAWHRDRGWPPQSQDLIPIENNMEGGEVLDLLEQKTANRDGTMESCRKGLGGGSARSGCEVHKFNA